MRFRSLVYILILIVAAFGAAASAQSGPPPGDVRPEAAQPDRQRPNLLHELGLSPEQMQQLKQINLERRPQIEAAMKRLGEANRSLDEAIYADVVNENDIAARLSEVENAQAALARTRFSNELAVRKILTPDQLVRFRDMRRQFAEAREKFRDARRGQGPGRSFRPMNRQAKPVQE